MTVNIKVGQITGPGIIETPPLTVQYDGIGFTPKAIILWTNRRTSDGSSTTAYFSYGISDGTNQGVISFTSKNASTAQYSLGSHSDILSTITTAGVELDRAQFKYFHSNGFALEWYNSGITTITINYIVLGGDVNVKMGYRDFPASTGNESITGIGFAPTGLITLNGMLGGSSGTINTSAFAMIGLCDKNLNQYILQGDDLYQQSPTKAERRQFSGRNFDIYFTTTNYERGNVVSFDVDGWTQNWSVTIGNVVSEYLYLAIGGIDCSVGVFNQATTIGNQSITGLGFTPVLTNFFSVMGATNTLFDDHMRFMVGAATGSTVHEVTGTLVKGNVITPVTDSMLNSSACIWTATEGSPSVTTKSLAVFVSNDSDGFTINNTTVDATSREIVYMCFSNVAPPTVKILGNIKILGKVKII